MIQILLFLIYYIELNYTFHVHLNYKMVEDQITSHKGLHQDTTNLLIYHMPMNNNLNRIMDKV